MGGGPRFRFGESRVVGTAGMGGIGLPVRNSRGPLVLDWRHPCHGVLGHRDDALLLHFEDALGSRIPAIALWPSDERAQRHYFRSHDHPRIWREYVRHGGRDEGGPRMEFKLQHHCFVCDGRHLRRRRWIVLGHLYRSSPVLPDLVRRVADSDSRFDRNRRGERDGPAHSAEFFRTRLYPCLAYSWTLSRQSDGHALDRHCLRPWGCTSNGILDHGLFGGTTRAFGERHSFCEDGTYHRLFLQNGCAADCDSTGLAWSGGIAPTLGPSE